MNSIKLKNGHYLGEEFSSVSRDTLFDNLVSYAKSNASSIANIQYNRTSGFVKIIYTDPTQYLNIIKVMFPDSFLKKNLVRTTRLKLMFVPQLKKLTIVNDQDSNKLLYSITCNNKINVKDSIYFDDIAIRDFSNDYDCEKYLNCNYNIARLKYDVKLSIANTTSYDIENVEYEECVYLCYNSETNKLENLTFQDTMNTESSIDILNVIKMINGEEHDDIKELIKTDENFIRRYSFSNIKFSKTDFKMIDKSEIGFMNFRSFASQTILNEFDKNLDKNSTIIDED